MSLLGSSWWIPDFLSWFCEEPRKPSAAFPSSTNRIFLWQVKRGFASNRVMEKVIPIEVSAPLTDRLSKGGVSLSFQIMHSQLLILYTKLFSISKSYSKSFLYATATQWQDAKAIKQETWQALIITLTLTKIDFFSIQRFIHFISYRRWDHSLSK